MKIISRHLFLTLCTALLVLSCERETLPDIDKPEPEKPEEKVDDSVMKLESFVFRKNLNSSLKNDVNTTVGQETIDDNGGITYYVDPSSMIASFEVFANEELTDVSVNIAPSGTENFKTIDDGKTACDYMRPVTIRLSAIKDGKQIHRDYAFRFHNLNTGLPVMYLFTPDRQAITSKDIWTEGCRIFLDASGKSDTDGTQFTEDYYGEADQLRGRGNTTWGWNKKPYAVKLEKQAAMLGMPKHKRWALLANTCDRSFIRNRLAYEIANKCDGLEWTPRNRFVELVLNGKHIGLYSLIEQIRSDKDRVPIPDANEALDPAKGGNPNTDGSQLGYLIEIDRNWASESSRLWWATKRYNGSGTTTSYNRDKVSWANNMSYYTNYNSSKFNFGLKNPDDETLIKTSSSQFTYIKNFILDTEKSVLQSPHDLSRLDIDSFIDFWFVFELAMNQEPNNPGSCYMYKKPDAEGGKLFAGPVWDFDYGCFNADFTDGLYYDKRNNFQILNSLWYVGLFESSEFRNEVKTRWAALKPKLDLDEFIEQNRNYLKESAALNLALWPNMRNDCGDPNGESNMSTDQAIDRIKSNFNQRVSDLDRLISKMP